MSTPEKADNERVSLLGPKSILSGDFATTADLVILGQLDGGRVQAPHVTIGPAAHVSAERSARTRWTGSASAGSRPSPTDRSGRGQPRSWNR